MEMDSTLRFYFGRRSWPSLVRNASASFTFKFSGSCILKSGSLCFISTLSLCALYPSYIHVLSRGERGLAALEELEQQKPRSLTASQPTATVPPTQSLPNKIYFQQTLYAFTAGLGFGLASALILYITPLAQSGGPGNLLIGINMQLLKTQLQNGTAKAGSLFNLLPYDQWDACTGQSLFYLQSNVVSTNFGLIFVADFM